MIPGTNGTYAVYLRDAVRKYLDRGWVPIPVWFKTKVPKGEEWEQTRFAGFNMEELFPEGTKLNVGLLNGTPSGGFIDVDLDCPEARAAAPYLLPATQMIWGRQSAPGSHYGYVVPDPPDDAAKNYDDPTGGHLLEIRSTGGFTILPPSIAPADADQGKVEEAVIWRLEGEPASMKMADLRRAVHRLAAATLLARHWPTGRRHAAALAIAGALLRAGWTVEDVEFFLTAICAAANDAEVKDRVRAAGDTMSKLTAGEKTTGWPVLVKLLGRDGDTIVSQIRDWLGVTMVMPNSFRGTEDPPLPRYEPPMPWRPFPVELLPSAIRDFVNTVTAAMRCDPTYTALPALAAAAGMIGATRQIQLKKSWKEPAMTWAAVVGDSGTLKSPPFKRAIAPVIQIQSALLRQHREALERYRAELREYERLKKRCKDEDPGDPPEEPKCPRLYSRDTTVEALAGLLAQGGPRCLIGRDELSGWLASFNQYKSKGGSDQANWLELHSLGTLVVDRKTGDPKTIFVDGAGVSLCGGIQPGVLRAGLSAQHFSAGIPARLLFAYPPRRPKEWTDDDLDEEAEARYQNLIRRLAELQPCINEECESYPATLSLTPEAKVEWVRFYQKFARVQADVDGDLAAAFSKLEGYAARLSLVHHVCEAVASGTPALTPVGVGSIRTGIALAQWFAYEAERVYRMLGEQEVDREVGILVDAVQRQCDLHGGQVTPRQLQKSNSRRFRTSEEARAALESLVALGLGKWVAVDTGRNAGHQPEAFTFCTTHDTSDTSPFEEDEGDDGDCTTHAPDPEPTPPGEPGEESPEPRVDVDDYSDSASSESPSSVGSVVRRAQDLRSSPSTEDGGVAGDRTSGSVVQAPGEFETSSSSFSISTMGFKVVDADTSPWTKKSCTTHDTSDTSNSGTDARGSGRCTTHTPTGHPDTSKLNEVESHSTPMTSSGCNEIADPPSGSSVGSVVRRARDSRHETAVDGLTPDEVEVSCTTGRSVVQVMCTLVTTADDVAMVTAAVSDCAGPIAIDTETTGLDPRRHQIRLLQIATDRDVFVIDLFALSNPQDALQPLFEELHHHEVVGHNLIFDLRFLARLGFVPGRVFDTMLASQVLHAGERDGRKDLAHTLAAVAQREIGVELEKTLQKSDWGRRTLTSEQLRYAAADVVHIVQLAETLRSRLAEAGLAETANLEMRALPGIAAAGPVTLDTAAWTGLSQTASQDQKRLAAEMDAIAPDPNGLPGMASRNWNSPEAVVAAFRSLGVAITSTDDATLAAIEHPLATLLREYRSASKMGATYGASWLAKHAADGTVMPSWRQLGAESGRMSCSGPSLQQIPRAIEYRQCFIARPGHVLIKADYSQIELRIAAKVANESVMLAAYDAGDDLHTLTASSITGKSLAAVTKADRQLAKALNFGLLYGMGWRRLRDHARDNYGIVLSDTEARRYRNTFFKTYPSLKAWHDQTETELSQQIRKDLNSFFETRTLGGRRRSIPAAKRDSKGQPYPNKTEALNTPVQGTGADGLKAAIALLWERRHECPNTVPLLFVHDEVVLEVPESQADMAKDWLTRCLVDGMSPLIDPVPVAVEVNVGRTWGG